MVTQVLGAQHVPGGGLHRRQQVNELTPNSSEQKDFLREVVKGSYVRPVRDADLRISIRLILVKPRK